MENSSLIETEQQNNAEEEQHNTNGDDEEEDDYEGEYDDSDSDYNFESEDNEDEDEDEEFEDEKEILEDLISDLGLEGFMKVLCLITKSHKTLQLAEVVIRNYLQNGPTVRGNGDGDDDDDDQIYKACPICFLDSITSGDHHICCLPCGHVFNLPCLTKWLQWEGGPGQCPKCDSLCTLKDVRLIYPPVKIVDEEYSKTPLKKYLKEVKSEEIRVQLDEIKPQIRSLIKEMQVKVKKEVPEDYEDGVEEDYDREKEVDELIPVEMTSSRISSSIADITTSLETMVIDDNLQNDSIGGGGGQNRGEIDVCPICFQDWTSAGHRQVCCLPCGHPYGKGCVNKWLQRQGGSGKCPQCNDLCTLEDVRVWDKTTYCVIDVEFQKAQRPLEKIREHVRELVREEIRVQLEKMRAHLGESPKDLCAQVNGTGGPPIFLSNL